MASRACWHSQIGLTRPSGSIQVARFIHIPLNGAYCRFSSRRSRLDSGKLKLGQQSCEPCEGKGGPQALSHHEAEDHLESLQSGWEIERDGQERLHLSRTWKTKNFLAALELSRRFGDVAEQEGHHPDVHITGWNRLKLVLWTHSRNGLTLNDFVLAAKLDDVDTEELLWKRKEIA